MYLVTLHHCISALPGGKLAYFNIIYLMRSFFDTSYAKNKESSRGRGAGRRCFGSATSGGPPFFMRKDECVPHPLSVCCLVCCAYVPGTPLAEEDALRTALSVGLHHSCRLHRGGCNPILFGGAVVQPVKRKRALLCALTRSSPSTPPLFCRVSPSFSLICSLPARWGWSAAHTPPGSSHRIVHPTDRAPRLSRRDTAELSPPPLFLFQCLHRGDLLHARHSGDVPEHVHIRDGVGFTWEYAALTLSELSPRRAHTFGLHRLSLKRKKENTPDYKDGVLRHFEDDFLQSE